jgi:AcrR family transcriptional regulator
VARAADQEKRRRLIEAAIDHLDRHGVAEFSLRRLAEAIGTSARMLVHYFGTKENLLSQALAASRPDVPALFGTVRDAAGLREAAFALWQDSAEGAQRRNVKLLLQTMALATAPGHHYRPFVQEAVTAWVTPLAAAFVRIGLDEAEAEARATALVSGLRGLLLDRYATHDTTRTDAAAQALINALLPPQ